MKKNDAFYRFKKGYRRPISMPRWKWMIIYTIWTISVIGYLLAMISSLWFLILGVLCQSIGLYLPPKWDTGSWKNTKEGQEYINKFND